MNINIEAESETSVRISFGNSIDENVFRRITAVNEALHQSPFIGFVESVPAYTTLTIFYEPLIVVESSEEEKGIYAYKRVISYLERLIQQVSQSYIPTAAKPIKIPVCYGGRFGPDIEEVAEHNKLSIEEVIQLHTETIYTVYLVGFLPGFPYLGGMNEKLATPRRLAPRKRVAAGSVGIAGAQTGIYPIESPGGWQLIGRTPMPLFDALSDSPALFSAGDRVQFCPISSTEFNELSPGL